MGKEEFTNSEVFNRIKSLYFNQEQSDLSKDEMLLLKRCQDGVIILCHNANKSKAAIKLHELYPNISLSQAELEINMSFQLLSKDKPSLKIYFIESLISLLSKEPSKNIQDKYIKMLKKELKNTPDYLKSNNISSIDDFINEIIKKNRTE